MRLVAATTEEQKTQRDVLSYSEWGKLLTLEGYVSREQRLRAHPWARANMHTWLLCEEDGAVLASCETFRTDSFLRSQNGALLPGDSFSIASVFTEERLRGHGYATRLMDMLAARLEHEPRAHASLLFSDVGPRIYARSGYRELPAWNWHLSPTPGAPGEHVDLLTREEDLGRALARMRLPDAPFFFWPSPAQLDWHLERGRIYVGHLGCSLPQSLGATTGQSTILWGLVSRTAELTVLMLDARSPEEAQALLGAARREASRSGLSRVLLWEEPAHASLLPLVEGATRAARDGSLPMVRPLRPDLPSSPLLPIPRGLWV
ncbi:GNAT family N-acetyltransferase [Vitiosangium sp. GDMCC 1.1324]|uniref:GNAT family N-acetyltransferase n=1 Tax=Vitiosangium sp. (strain GDMCC 1.1324) TaxID=2138576 RepID=UPI000D3894FB|nr:GNAT family N-acetyltransferase [Vitiosangium sp. GDMCC 1.1324]PTL84040.1 N-acetyltransferase [Vitiosangium sp. GDMCC 1.1324]